MVCVFFFLMHFHRSLLPSGLPPKASVQLYEHIAYHRVLVYVSHIRVLSVQGILFVAVAVSLQAGGANTFIKMDKIVCAGASTIAL